MCARALLDDSDEELSFKINQSYVKNYNERKEREELTKLKSEHGDISLDEASESSEPEDENGELLIPAVDGRIMNVFSAIRNKRPEIYDKSVTFFDDSSLLNSKAEWKKLKKACEQEKKNVMTLKDYHVKVLKGEINTEESDEETDPREDRCGKKLSYDNEQEEARQKLRSAVMDVEEDDFLTVKVKTEDEVREEDEKYREFLLENMAKGGDGVQNWIENKTVNIDDPNEKFLMDYVLNRGWIEKKNELSYDSDESSSTQEPETAHQFRHEEESGKAIITHGRRIEGLVRRADERRIEKRKRRLERKKATKTRKENELERYKVLKKKEIMKRLNLIERYTNVPLGDLKKLDLEGDFDAEKFDSQMAKIFNEDYYQEEPQDGDTKDDSEFSTKIITSPASNEPLNTSKRRKKVKSKELLNYSFKDAVDELLNVNYEDTVAGLPVRFKYTKVHPTDYGLTPDEILMLDDSQLNSIVPLSKYAPYRDKEEDIREDRLLRRKIQYKKKKVLGRTKPSKVAV